MLDITAKKKKLLVHSLYFFLLNSTSEVLVMNDAFHLYYFVKPEVEIPKKRENYILETVKKKLFMRMTTKAGLYGKRTCDTILLF